MEGRVYYDGVNRVGGGGRKGGRKHCAMKSKGGQLWFLGEGKGKVAQEALHKSFNKKKYFYL